MQVVKNSRQLVLLSVVFAIAIALSIFQLTTPVNAKMGCSEECSTDRDCANSMPPSSCNICTDVFGSMRCMDNW